MSAGLLPGRLWPFGAHVRDEGVNFAVYSEHASRIELCIVNENGVEFARHELFKSAEHVFHGFLPGAQPGLIYGYRAHGDYAPERGLFFNPYKLLLDPYTRDIVGQFQWQHEQHAYRVGEGIAARDERDNAALALKSRVVADAGAAPGWRNAPRIAPHKRVLYEVHVKGFSQNLSGVAPSQRGTYAALASDAAITHFKRLGVTTLSLLPVHWHIDEGFLSAKGLSNYWGYNTIGFFAANPRWAVNKTDTAAATQELRDAIAKLHEHGLEVMLDVVYNHSAEGNEWGASVSFRGLDHATWYRLDASHGQRCVNWTGCGNTLNMHHPRVMQMVLDSLRYWAHDVGVDGFRFDLAPILGRTREHFDPNAAFFQAAQADPVLSQVALIAESWDAGPHGYHVGGFPGPWLEWNDKFRDAVRSYWIGRGADRAMFARRFLASSDVYQDRRRAPTCSVNFITAHDGFTAADVVSYSHKHNHANGEDNRDGRDDELCANFGVEGPTQDPSIRAARERVLRAMLTTLALAQGTPMFTAGDEIAKTQGGNNNAYCQDSALSWLDWAQADQATLEVLRQALLLRSQLGALQHNDWFRAPAGHGSVHASSAPRACATVSWYLPKGEAPHPADWHDASDRTLACVLDARAVPAVPGDAADSSRRVLIAFNPEAHARDFALPDGNWSVALDSSGVHVPGAALQRACFVGRQSVLVATSRA